MNLAEILSTLYPYLQQILLSQGLIFNNLGMCVVHKFKRKISSGRKLLCPTLKSIETGKRELIEF